MAVTCTSCFQLAPRQPTKKDATSARPPAGADASQIAEKKLTAGEIRPGSVEELSSCLVQAGTAVGGQSVAAVDYRLKELEAAVSSLTTSVRDVKVLQFEERLERVETYLAEFAAKALRTEQKLDARTASCDAQAQPSSVGASVRKVSSPEVMVRYPASRGLFLDLAPGASGSARPEAPTSHRSRYLPRPWLPKDGPDAGTRDRMREHEEAVDKRHDAGFDESVVSAQDVQSQLGAMLISDTLAKLKKRTDESSSWMQEVLETWTSRIAESEAYVKHWTSTNFQLKASTKGRPAAFSDSDVAPKTEEDSNGVLTGAAQEGRSMRSNDLPLKDKHPLTARERNEMYLKAIRAGASGVSGKPVVQSTKRKTSEKRERSKSKSYSSSPSPSSENKSQSDRGKSRERQRGREKSDYGPERGKNSSQGSNPPQVSHHAGGQGKGSLQETNDAMVHELAGGRIGNLAPIK